MAKLLFTAGSGFLWTIVGRGFSDRSCFFVRRTVLGCRRCKSSIVGPTFLKFLLILREGDRVATESRPSLSKFTFLLSANALFIEARTASRARFASPGFTPVSATMAATNVFLMIFGILISHLLLACGFDLGLSS